MVQYFLSGAVGARVDGAAATLGGPKQRCLLAVLLANHGTVVSIDRLIDAVWGDEPPPKALTSVRSYVANLRRILDPCAETGASANPDVQRLTSHPHGYQLNLLTGDSVDLLTFESLVAAGRTALIRRSADAAVGMLNDALALWHGDPFGEFAYHEFAAPEVIRFTALRTTAIEARFDAALQLGGGGELIPEVEAALAEHPLQERLWGHLMLALHRSNRTADAIAAFERACTTLDREIGTRPPARDCRRCTKRSATGRPNCAWRRPRTYPSHRRTSWRRRPSSAGRANSPPSAPQFTAQATASAD